VNKIENNQSLQIENIGGNDNVLVFSLGGSVIFDKHVLDDIHNLGDKILEEQNFNDEQLLLILSKLNEYNPTKLDRGFICGFIGLLKQLTDQEYDIKITVGGGTASRDRIRDTKTYGPGNSEDQLDWLGIAVSKTNATQVLANIKREGLEAYWYFTDPNKRAGSVGNIAVRGGTVPGGTTDLVAMRIAIEHGAPYVINISNTPGLHPVLENGELVTNKIIQMISSSQFLALFPNYQHESGGHYPFEPQAVILGESHQKGIILVGKHIENLYNLIQGKKAKGTLIYP
jgi:uridylate kinase